MKCIYCGNNLNIDDKFCGFCGKENVHAQKHREEMEHFRDDYNRTKGVVIEKSGRTVSIIAKGTIIVGLVLICLLILIATSNSYRIRDWVAKVEISKDINTHISILDRLENDRDFFGLTSYYESNELYFSKDLSGFRAIVNMSSNYLYIYNNTFQLLNYEKYPYTSKEKLIEHVSDYIKSFYDRFKYNEYEPEQYSETHMAAMEDLRTELETFIHVYLNVPREDIETFQDISSGKIQFIVERSVGYSED